MPHIFFPIFYNAGGTGAWIQFKCWSFWPLSDRRHAIKHGVIVFMLESNFCCQTEGCNAIDTCHARLHASVLVFIASARTAIRVPSPEPKGMCVCILSKKKGMNKRAVSASNSAGGFTRTYTQANIRLSISVSMETIITRFFSHSPSFSLSDSTGSEMRGGIYSILR